MGALTLKSFPFELRGWDIEKFESIDPTDGFGISTRVYISKQQIIQIEPDHSETTSNAWLSDKGRQFFDGTFGTRSTQNNNKKNFVFKQKFYKKYRNASRCFYINSKNFVAEVQFLTTKLIVIICTNYSLTICSATIIIRIILYSYLNDLAIYELFTTGLMPIERTSCMPYAEPDQLVTALLKNEVTRPTADAGGLAANVKEFQKLAHELQWEFWYSQVLKNDAGDENSEVLEGIAERIVPEKWGTRIDKLNKIIDDILRTYDDIHEILEPEFNPYREAMQKHSTLLKAIQNNVEQSRNDLRSLEHDMVNWRKRHNVAITDSSIPDQIIVPKIELDSLIKSVEDNISVITPPQKEFDLPSCLGYNELIRELLNDPKTNNAVLSTKVQDKIKKFREIAEYLDNQFSISREFIQPIDENPEAGLLVVEDLETPKIKKLILDELVPELWINKLAEMQSLTQEIPRAYLRIDNSLNNNSNYTVPMQQHGTLIRNVYNAVYRAAYDLQPLQLAMMDMRRGEGASLADNVHIPESVKIIKMSNLNNLGRPFDEM